MTDAIWLIRSDTNGNPHPGGSIGHYVLVTQNPHPAVFNEFNDGGAFQHADCGPACVLSALADRGQHPAARLVESACSTGQTGTSVAGVSQGLGHFGVVNTWAAGNPAPGYIMNPAGGRIIPPSEFPAYRAASAGYVVNFAATTAGADVTPEEHAWLLAVYNAIYGASPPQAWNNIEILRRQAVANGAPYGPAGGAPPTPPPAPAASGGLTAAQAAAIAEIPALQAAVTAGNAALGRIETALKGA